MDSQELPSTQTQQNQAGADQGVARKTGGRPRKESRPAAQAGDAQHVEGFTVPARPEVSQEEKQDPRKFAVIPIWAINAKVSNGAFRTLALIASYANRNGFTWVSQETLAKVKGVTFQAISKHVQELKQAGIIEETAKAYWGGPTARCSTMRVIFDQTLSADDVIAKTGSADQELVEPTSLVESTRTVVPNIQKANGVITSLNDEVVNRKQEPTRSDLERLRPALIHEVQERYRREGLPVPIGDRLAREVADLASIKARSGTLLA